MILSKTVMILFITREPMEPECSYRSYFEANLILCQMVLNIGTVNSRFNGSACNNKSHSNNILKSSFEIFFYFYIMALTTFHSNENF